MLQSIRAVGWIGKRMGASSRQVEGSRHKTRSAVGRVGIIIDGWHLWAYGGPTAQEQHELCRCRSTMHSWAFVCPLVSVFGQNYHGAMQLQILYRTSRKSRRISKPEEPRLSILSTWRRRTGSLSCRATVCEEQNLDGDSQSCMKTDHQNQQRLACFSIRCTQHGV